MSTSQESAPSVAPRTQITAHHMVEAAKAGQAAEQARAEADRIRAERAGQ